MSTAGKLSITDRRAALEEAIAQVADGKREALELVYALTSAKLLAMIMQVVQDRDAAEDVLQDTFIKVWTRAGRFDRTRASPITWLCAIARNSAIDAVRKAGRRGEVSDDTMPEIEDEGPNADEMLCNAEDSERLQDCLNSLQQDHRRCIRLAFFRGLTHSELASSLEVPLGTMKSWIRRGLLSLKGCLDGG